MTPLSVVIITFNEERNIGRCIDSVKMVADEIIVLDSNSTDATVSIAREKGAIVHSQSFLGYIEQKNRALDLASHEMVLSLDADEALDETLRNAIMQAKNGTMLKGYRMNRCTNYCGKFIRHGSWYPDRKMRLVNKTVARWGGDNPHDRLDLQEETPTGLLKGDILHYSYNSVDEHVSQNNKFSTISANALFARGKRTSVFKIIINPWWAFVQSYLIRLGFLDGFLGFVVSVNIAHLTFLKHVKLYQLQRG